MTFCAAEATPSPQEGDPTHKHRDLRKQRDCDERKPLGEMGLPLKEFVLSSVGQNYDPQAETSECEGLT